MVAPAATSPLDFSPGDTLAEAILIDLSSPNASLASVAAKHHTETATLSLWLTKPETQALLHSIESGGYAHTRLAASLNLSAAVPVLLQILTDFRTLSKSTTDLTDPVYQRASIHARKAAWMLLRLARSHPLTPAQLSAARTTLDATRAAEPPPISTSPTPTLAPAASQVSPVLAAQPLGETETHTSAEPLPQIKTPITTKITNHPEPCATPEPIEPAPHQAPSLSAASFDADTTPADDLSDLVAHLSSIAESLGIDISELDQFDDLDNLNGFDKIDDLLSREDLPATAPNNATGPPQSTPHPKSTPQPTVQNTTQPTVQNTTQPTGQHKHQIA